MHMTMIILFGSDVAVDSSVEAVIMYSLSSICSTLVLTFSRLAVCAGYVSSYKIKHYSWLLRIVRDLVSHTVEAFFAARCCSL
jgi:hypothetical protein